MVECTACASSEVERITGEILDFIGHPTICDRENGWTYLYCPDCGTVQNWWTDRIVAWDLSHMAMRLEEFREVSKTGG